MTEAPPSAAQFAPGARTLFGSVGLGNAGPFIDLFGEFTSEVGIKARQLMRKRVNRTAGVALDRPTQLHGWRVAEYDIEDDGSLNFRRRFGSMKSPDGICLDRDGAVWVASFDEDAFIRVGRDGRELQRIEVPGRRALACVLGGAERRTLFCLSAATSYQELRQRKSSSRIDTADVEIPGAGFP